MEIERIALIPAYRPGKTLIEILRQLEESAVKIVIVDDGSGPEFAPIFQQARRHAEVLSFEENAGKGMALKTGLRHIAEHYPESAAVVTMDADGQHNVLDALHLLAVASQQTDGIVLGCRPLEEANLSTRVSTSIAREAYLYSTGLAISDTQTGLRAFRVSMIPRLAEIEGTRYEYEMNVLLTCAEEGIPIREEQISAVVNTPQMRKDFHILTDTLRILKEFMKFGTSSFVSFSVDYALFIFFRGLLLAADAGSTLIVANIGARIVSSTLNYNLNRRFVFRHRKTVSNSAVRFYCLAAAILAMNSVVLKSLTGLFGINTYAAKLMTEIIMFFFNWTGQRWFIFSREDKEKKEANH